LKTDNWELVVPSRETLAGDTARRHTRRKALGFAVLLSACMAGALGFARWSAQYPMEVQLERLEPSLMVDHCWIATIGISNSSPGQIYLNTHALRVEAREAEKGGGVTNLWGGPAWVMPNCKATVLILVPQKTEACRISVPYSTPTIREKLTAFSRLHPPPSVYLASLIDQWLWPARPPGWAPPPRRWVEAKFEVGTPRELGRSEE
jgi:hypothetical protein